VQQGSGQLCLDPSSTILSATTLSENLLSFPCAGAAVLGAAVPGVCAPVITAAGAGGMRRPVAAPRLLLGAGAAAANTLRGHDGLCPGSNVYMRRVSKNLWCSQVVPGLNVALRLAVGTRAFCPGLWLPGLMCQTLAANPVLPMPALCAAHTPALPPAEDGSLQRCSLKFCSMSICSRKDCLSRHVPAGAAGLREDCVVPTCLLKLHALSR